VIHHSAQIHPLAFVDDSVRIGAGTTIHQFASVTRGTVLGKDCSVAPGACLDGPRFGDGCRIGINAAMGPGFVIGNDVFIGPLVCLANDYWPRAHKDGFDYDDLRDGKVICVAIDDGASLSMNSSVLPGVQIGARSMVAAHACVDKDLPDDHLFCRDGRIRPIHRELRRMRDCDRSFDGWIEFSAQRKRA